MSRSGFGIIGAPVLFIGVLQTMEMTLSPALPLIQRELAASPEALAWIFTGSLISSAISTPIVGRLADMYDKRRLLLTLMAITSAGVLLTALAPNVTVLIAGMAVEGVWLGMLPLTVGLFRDTLEPEQAATGNGLVIGVAALASALGLILAGPISAALGYRWLFILALAGALVAALWAWFVVPATPRAAAGRVDWAGGLLLGGGLALLMLGLTTASSWGWTAPATLALFTAAALTLGLWAVIELRSADPLVDLRLLAGRTPAGVTTMGFVFGFASFGLVVALPMMLAAPVETGYGLGADILWIGIYMFPMGVAGTVIAPLVGPMSRLLGRRAVLVLGSGLVCAGTAMLAFWHSSPWEIVAGVTIMGLGGSIGLTAALNAVAADVPADRAAGVSGVVFVAKSIGGTFGAQLGAMVLAAGSVAGVPTESSFVDTYLLSAGLGLLAVGAAFVIPSAVRQAKGVGVVSAPATKPAAAHSDTL
ncbi:MFS family permease [Streptosporangium becharense]|uniref:MFS family permease n=1 Tax=Streptosporangium becharense TaxID=1816182 RepID=A0A7W9IBB6_9ACTN|nr:MFS transporter [Streptosporangium becharense]MBB2910705.1 MFS family permease [Streptosporangium becharense]MBB5817400.1 MFS family permease [Streptosporangium becharense]